MFEKYLNFINANTVVKVFLVKKKGKQYTSYLLPNNIDNEIKYKYNDNLSNFLNNKELTKYDFVYDKKNCVSFLDANNLELKNNILNSIQENNREQLKKSNFSDDYNFIIFQFDNYINNEIKSMYFFSKYAKPETWYKKGIKFAFISDYMIEMKSDILVLNGEISCVLLDNDMLILNASTFESIFNYYESAKTLVESKKDDIFHFEFLDNPQIFYDKIISGKTRIKALANAFNNSQTNWLSIDKEIVFNVLTSDERFKDLEFDDNHQIICTDKNTDLIIDIIRETYSRQLFTNKIIETKGV